MSVQIIVPRKAGETLPAEFERELRHGGRLARAMAREKALTDRRLARAALPYRDYERRRGAEQNLRAVVDARTFMRWQLTDPNFWTDRRNLEKFIQDNPVVAPWRRWGSGNY